MRKTLLLVMIFVAGNYLAGCATPLQNNASEDEVLHGEVELTVYGMSCPLCASNLDRHLQQLPGIDEMWPDLDTGAVRITLKEGHTLPASAFRRAVRDAGFTMQSIRRVEPMP